MQPPTVSRHAHAETLEDILSRKLFKSTFVVGGMTLVSRVFGVLRDVAIAVVFPVGAGTDAFLVAFKIPNLLRRLVAEGSFSLAFVPVLSEFKERRSGSELRDLIDHVAGALTVALFAITAIGIVAAPLLVAIFAPGFLDDAERHELASAMLRITFPYILFISLTAFAGGILNTFGRFAVPAFTPVLLNLSLIGCGASHTAQPIRLRFNSTGVKAGTAKRFQVLRMPPAIAVIEISRM